MTYMITSLWCQYMLMHASSSALKSSGAAAPPAGSCYLTTYGWTDVWFKITTFICCVSAWWVWNVWYAHWSYFILIDLTNHGDKWRGNWSDKTRALQKADLSINRSMMGEFLFEFMNQIQIVTSLYVVDVVLCVELFNDNHQAKWKV